MRNSLLALVVLGCGGGSSSDSLDVMLANTAVAAIRSGDTWKPVEKTATGEATLDIDSPTMLALVCDGSFFNYYTLYLGPGIDDEQPLDLSCIDAAPATIEVTIDSPSPTQVFIGLASNYLGGSLDVVPGTHDVIAIDDSVEPPRFEIRRGVTISGPTTLSFDLATTGTAMVPAQVSATGAGSGETPSLRTRLYTANRTYATMAAIGGSSWLFPASALQAGDRQAVVASTSSETLGLRSHRRDVSGGETAIALALPEYLASVTATASAVTWQGDADWDGFYYGINSPSFDVLWDVSVFPEWTLAGGEVDTISIPDPTGIPGWQSAWNLGATAGYEWYFSASHAAEPDYFSASHGGTL